MGPETPTQAAEGAGFAFEFCSVTALTPSSPEPRSSSRRYLYQESFLRLLLTESVAHTIGTGWKTLDGRVVGRPPALPQGCFK
jgi:hypothetical protein